MDKTNALSLTGGGMFDGGWTPVWLIKDEFTGTVAAGSVNGTAATPGPGTRAVTDTENKLSVGSGVLAIAGGKASPAWGDPEIIYGLIPRAIGVGFLSKINLSSAYSYMQAGWASSSSPGQLGGHSIYFNDAGTKLSIRNIVTGNVTLLGDYTTGVDYRVSVVQRSTGAFYFICGGAYTNWTLIWVSLAGNGDYYPGIASYNTPLAADYLRVIALPAPFDTDDGLATDTHSGNVAAGTTFTHEADFVMEFTVNTLPSSGNIWVFSRVADSNNFWWMVIGSTGTFLLYEKNAGVLTERARANNVVANGHRIVVVAEGTTIKAYYNNTLAWSYAGAANAATATSGELDALATGGAVSDLITWPRTLSGTAASILNKASG